PLSVSTSYPPLSSYSPAPPTHLPSFPTRRSSDLEVHFRCPGGNFRYRLRRRFRPGDPCAPAGCRSDKLRLPGRDDLVVLHWLCLDRKSTRLNSSHQIISYAVFCLKKKKIRTQTQY